MIKTDWLREALFQARALPASVLSEIHKQKWLNIWVPKVYGGLDLSFTDGLQVLQKLAAVDGSLGWTVTLCSGAHYFSRNMLPETAFKLFNEKNIFIGGSGTTGGTAEIKNNSYILNGKWPYATGAPYLTHFTLNAQLTEKGRLCKGTNGQPVIKSFIIPADKVQQIQDWQAIGMQATCTFSFEITSQKIPASYAFAYDVFYVSDSINHIPFRLFADATLLANYLGMAVHFAEEAKHLTISPIIKILEDFIAAQSQKLYKYAQKTETLLKHQQIITLSFQDTIHLFCKETVHRLAHLILEVYLALGLKAALENSAIQHILNDFYTATQHAHFRSKPAAKK